MVLVGNHLEFLEGSGFWDLKFALFVTLTHTVHSFHIFITIMHLKQLSISVLFMTYICV